MRFSLRKEGTVWKAIIVASVVLAFVFAGGEAQQKTGGIYKCVSVEAPNVLNFEALGKVVLIGVQPPEATDEGFEVAMNIVRRYAQGKSLKVEVCPLRAKDEEGRLRAIVYFREGNAWHNLNTKLLRAGYANLKSEERCHVNVKEWSQFVAQAQSQRRGLWARLQPKPEIEMDYVMALQGLRIAESYARVPRKVLFPQLPPTSPERFVKTAEKLLPIAPALREPYNTLARATTDAYVQLRNYIDARERCLTLENALRTGVPIRPLSPTRLMELFIERDLPAPTNMLTGTVRADGGKTIWDALQQFYLTESKEPLDEILSWFPAVQNEFRNRLMNLGAQLAGGPTPTAPTTTAPAGVPGGAPLTGMPPGAPAETAPFGAPPTGMPPGAAPTALGAPTAPTVAGGLQAYYELLGRIRARRVEPEEACLLFLALRTYRREYLEPEIDRLRRRYDKALEEQRKFEEFMKRQLQRTASGR